MATVDESATLVVKVEPKQESDESTEDMETLVETLVKTDSDMSDETTILEDQPQEEPTATVKMETIEPKEEPIAYDDKSENVMDYKIMYGKRDLLDMGANLTDSKFDLRYAELPENNLKMFFQNRSQYHRLGANGERQEFSFEKCKCCDFYYPMIIYNNTNNNATNTNKTIQDKLNQLNPTVSSLMKNVSMISGTQKNAAITLNGTANVHGAFNQNNTNINNQLSPVQSVPRPDQQLIQKHANINQNVNGLQSNIQTFFKNYTPENVNVITPQSAAVGPIVAPIPITKKNNFAGSMYYNNVPNQANNNINYFDTKSTKINNFNCNFGNASTNTNYNTNGLMNANNQAAPNATNAALALYNYMNGAQPNQANPNKFLNNNMNNMNTGNTSRFGPTPNNNSNALAALLNNNNQSGGIYSNNQSNNGNFPTFFGGLNNNACNNNNANTYGLYKQF